MSHLKSSNITLPLWIHQTGIMPAMIDDSPAQIASPAADSPARRANYWRIAFIIVVALGLNLLVLMIPRAWIDSLRGYGLLGYVVAFGITAMANASVIVPVPYPALIAQLASVLGNPIGVALAGAAGSTLGESTAFLVGRAGRGVVEDTRFYRLLKAHLRTPRRAWLIIFVLSAPPNPFFDVAGITAGSLGLPYWLFVTATFAGRIIKLLFFAGLGAQFL
jgi:membrane protein YqaA with SNARE-associated domain